MRCPSILTPAYLDLIKCLENTKEGAASGLMPVPQNEGRTLPSCRIMYSVPDSTGPMTPNPEYNVSPPTPGSVWETEPSYKCVANVSSMLNGEFNVRIWSVERLNGVSTVMSKRSSPAACASSCLSIRY